MSEETSSDASPSSGEDAVLTATPEQLFTGSETGLPSLEATCRLCGQTLHEGAPCTVYVYQTADDVQWYTRGCYCSECTPTSIQTPTLGTTEVLVQAVLGIIASQARQTYRLCLTNVSLVAQSPPTEGCEP